MRKLLIYVMVVCLICIGCPHIIIDYGTEYDLEIQNGSGVDILVDIGLHEQPSDIHGKTWRSIPAGSNKTITMFILLGYVHKHPNRFVRDFSAIEFYNPDTKELVAEYHYRLQNVYGMDIADNDALKDEELLYTVLEKNSDGAWQEVPEASIEKLFVPSDTRPFYLERDKDNANLAYLIITDVPTP